MILKPMPPVGTIIVDSMFGAKKEQRVNDANFLEHLASYFEDNCILHKEGIRIKEIADRLNKR